MGGDIWEAWGGSLRVSDSDECIATKKWDGYTVRRVMIKSVSDYEVCVYLTNHSCHVLIIYSRSSGLFVSICGH